MSRVLEDHFVVNSVSGYVDYGADRNRGEAPMPMPLVNFAASASPRLLERVKAEPTANVRAKDYFYDGGTDVEPEYETNESETALVMPTINFEHEFEQRQASWRGGDGGQRVEQSDPYGDDTPLIPPSLF